MSTQPIPILTAQQYLEIERAAKWKSEFLMGEMFAMAGASRAHAQVSFNAAFALGKQLEGRECRIALSDLRVAITPLNVMLYPDVVVTCGPEKYFDAKGDTLVDASVIVEVLSPSTRNQDRGEKFRYYRQLPSLGDYLLLAQDSVRAEHHFRKPDGSWVLRVCTETTDELELASIGCRVTLAELYRMVTLAG